MPNPFTRKRAYKNYELEKSFWCDFYCGESLSMRLTIIWCLALTPQGLLPPGETLRNTILSAFIRFVWYETPPPASLVFDIKSTALFTAIKFAMSQTGKALDWLHFRCWRMFHARSHAGSFYQQCHQLITLFLVLFPTFSLLSCCTAKKARQHEWQVVEPFEQYDNSTVKCAT